MSDAKKCDRCGKFYVQNENDEDERFIFSTDKGLSMPLLGGKLISCGNHIDYYDLCSKCANKLIRWFNNPEEAVCQGGE